MNRAGTKLSVCKEHRFPLSNQELDSNFSIGLSSINERVMPFFLNCKVRIFSEGQENFKNIYPIFSTLIWKYFDATKGPTLYLVSIRLVIVIVISAMFTFYSVQSYRLNIADILLSQEKFDTKPVTYFKDELWIELTWTEAKFCQQKKNFLVRDLDSK